MGALRPARLRCIRGHAADRVGRRPSQAVAAICRPRRCAGETPARRWGGLCLRPPLPQPLGAHFMHGAHIGALGSFVQRVSHRLCRSPNPPRLWYPTAPARAWWALCLRSPRRQPLGAGPLAGAHLRARGSIRSARTHPPGSPRGGGGGGPPHVSARMQQKTVVIPAKAGIHPERRSRPAPGRR